MSYKAVQFLLTPKGNGWETFYKLCVTHIVSVLYMTSFDIVGAGLVPCPCDRATARVAPTKS